MNSERPHGMVDSHVWWWRDYECGWKYLQMINEIKSLFCLCFHFVCSSILKNDLLHRISHLCAREKTVKFNWARLKTEWSVCAWTYHSGGMSMVCASNKARSWRGDKSLFVSRCHELFDFMWTSGRHNLSLTICYLRQSSWKNMFFVCLFSFHLEDAPHKHVDTRDDVKLSLSLGLDWTRACAAT